MWSMTSSIINYLFTIKIENNFYYLMIIWISMKNYDWSWLYDVYFWGPFSFKTIQIIKLKRLHVRGCERLRRLVHLK